MANFIVSCKLVKAQCTISPFLVVGNVDLQLLLLFCDSETGSVFLDFALVYVRVVVPFKLTQYIYLVCDTSTHYQVLLTSKKIVCGLENLHKANAHYFWGGERLANQDANTSANLPDNT